MAEGVQLFDLTVKVKGLEYAPVSTFGIDKREVIRRLDAVIGKYSVAVEISEHSPGGV